jgi:hypothetical protein
MKKILAIALAAVSMGFVVSAEAKAADMSEQNTVQQYQRDRYYGRRYNRRTRTVRRSRIVRYGRRVYRETYLVTYWSNGRTTTRLIDRDRIS